MSDLEQELTGALTTVADDAPGAVGLADAARRRHRVRRQRRLAAGAAVAALVVGVGAVLAGVVGGNDRASDPVDEPGPTGWQTVEVDGGAALVSLPPDWTAYECASGDADPATVYGPPGGDTCADGSGAVFLPAGIRGEFDDGELISGDGGWLGHVLAGDWEVRVFLEDRALVRQILATARVAGEPVIDGSTWVGFDHGGMTFEVPAWWGVGEDGGHDDYSVCFTPSDFDGREAFSTGDAYVLTDEPGPGDVVRVTAPTQAVAELVLATVRLGKEARASEDCAPEDFTTGLLPGESTAGAGTPVEGGERPLDLPTSDWKPGDPSLKAGIHGTLVLDADRCVVLAYGSDPSQRDHVVWPAGFTAALDGTGSLVLRGPDGEVVAREGDRIDAGGGYGDGRAGTHRCLPAGSEDIASIMSEVTVDP